MDINNASLQEKRILLASQKDQTLSDLFKINEAHKIFSKINTQVRSALDTEKAFLAKLRA